MTAHDPYVHLSRATYRDRVSGRLLTGGVVQPDLWRPEKLVEQLDVADQVGETLELQGTWHGRAITAADVRALPQAPLFQDRLTAGAPQQCVH